MRKLGLMLLAGSEIVVGGQVWALMISLKMRNWEQEFAARTSVACPHRPNLSPRHRRLPIQQSIKIDVQDSVRIYAGVPEAGGR